MSDVVTGPAEQPWLEEPKEVISVGGKLFLVSAALVALFPGFFTGSLVAVGGGLILAGIASILHLIFKA